LATSAATHIRWPNRGLSAGVACCSCVKPPLTCTRAEAAMGRWAVSAVGAMRPVALGGYPGLLEDNATKRNRSMANVLRRRIIAGMRHTGGTFIQYLGHDDDVAGRRGVDVPERVRLIVLVHGRGWDLPGDDLVCVCGARDHVRVPCGAAKP
jgi:hypothetical protein